MTEREKWEAGLWYDANFDEELRIEREKAEERYTEFNQTRPSQKEKAGRAAAQAAARHGGRCGDPAAFLHGLRLQLRHWRRQLSQPRGLPDGLRQDHHWTALLHRPRLRHVHGHPSHPAAGAQQRGWSKPITLGDNVWLGGDVTILPGVTIGSNTVIGAGSVVVKDIPSGVVAVGNPCKVVRPITEEDSIYFHKD